MQLNYLKKIVPGVVLAATLLSLLPVGIPVAHAATIANIDYQTCVGSIATGGKGGTYKEDSSGAGFTSGTCTTPDGSTTKVGSTPDNGPGCGVTNGLNFSICITNVIYVFTVGIGSAFAYVAAFFFDLTIQLSLQSTAYALDFISTGWTLARDIANMAFIFILLFIAITIMLGAQSRTTSSLLVGVILIALLVNFSFFFSRVVIDAGNLLAVQFYNAIPDGGTTIGTTAANSSFGIGGNNSTLISQFTSLASGGQMKDLTYSIMQMMQLQNLFDTSGFQSFAQSDSAGFLSGFISLTFLYVAAGVLFWGLIVTFITVGIKFLMRIIVLWFLIIISPLAFIAYAIPNSKLAGKFDEWLSELVKHAFYPVGFMFVFFILTLFSSQLAGTNTTGGGSLVNGIFGGLGSANNANFLQLMAIAIANTAIRLGFVLGVMYIGMRASEFIGVAGGKIASDFGKKIGGQYIGASFGSAGWLGRNTVGWSATRLSELKGVQNLGARNALFRGTVFKGLKGIGSGSFDYRGPLAGTGLKDVAGGKATGKGGYIQQEKDRIKFREKQAKDFNLSDEQKETIKSEAAGKAKTEAAANFASAKKENTGKTEAAILTAAAAKIPHAAKLEAQQEAQGEYDKAANELRQAEEHIKDLQLQKKEGTPEMADAINQRNHTKLALGAAETELKGRKEAANTTLAALSKEEKVLGDLKKEATALEQKEKDEVTRLTKEYTPETDLKKVFAKNIGTADMNNLIRLGMWVPKADKNVSAKLRKEKGREEKALDILKQALEKDEDEEKKEEKKEDKKEDKKPDAH